MPNPETGSISLGEFDFNEAEIDGPRMLFYSDTGCKLILSADTCKWRIVDHAGNEIPKLTLPLPLCGKATSWLSEWHDEYNYPVEYFECDD